LGMRPQKYSKSLPHAEKVCKNIGLRGAKLLICSRRPYVSGRPCLERIEP